MGKGKAAGVKFFTGPCFPGQVYLNREAGGGRRTWVRTRKNKVGESRNVEGGGGRTHLNNDGAVSNSWLSVNT